MLTNFVQLCIWFLVFLAIPLWRVSSRAALGTETRKWLQEKLPDWVADSILFLSQWWVILAILLHVELITTRAGIWQVVDATIHQHESKRWLAELSCWACRACLVTYGLCLFSVVSQVSVAWCDAKSGRCGWYRGLKWVLPCSRDVVVQILFMPLVYHNAMCRSLLRQWAAINGASTELDAVVDASLHKQNNLLLSEANAGLAEMYDAYALWCFGNLGMAVACLDLRQRERVEEDPAHWSVFNVLQGTLMFGVKSYVVTSIFGALYSLVLAIIRLYINPQLCSEDADMVARGLNSTLDEGPNQDSGWCGFPNIIYGADFATSTIAIYNLFYFEHQMGEPLRKFRPSIKFWSMKIPVTLSFSELAVLKFTQPITGLGSDVVSLLDTTVKAYAMVIVALLNVRAWWPAEEWYRDEGLHGSTLVAWPWLPKDENAESESDSCEESLPDEDSAPDDASGVS